jgi:hypothetical protein
VGGVELGPEQGEERVSSVPGSRYWRDQISQERQAFWLPQQRIDLCAIRRLQANLTEKLELDHR